MSQNRKTLVAAPALIVVVEGPRLIKGLEELAKTTRPELFGEK